jgi:hypothetical protein
MEFNMNRRKFLTALSLGTAHVVFSNPLLAAGSKLTSANPLQMVKLGNSGLETTLIGFGTGVLAQTVHRRLPGRITPRVSTCCVMVTTAD